MHPKDRAQMMAYLTRPGMAKGGRVPFGKGNKPIKQALEEIAEEKGTKFKSVDELQKLVEDKVGYKPNKKVLRPSKHPILENFVYESKQIPFTDEEIKNFVEKNPKYKDALESKIRDIISSRKGYKNLSDEQKQKKLLREQKRKAERSQEQIALENEKAALRMQEQRGTLPDYYRGRKAEGRLWFDFIRSAESKDGYFKFKNFVPKEGKKYNKAETEAITLVDRKGNEFKFKSLIDDINKFSGYEADDVLLPYKQVEFLYTQGLTKELNKLANIKPGARQALFNVQHVQGIAKNPFNVMLTFADQNRIEAGSRRTFNSEFKNATNLKDKKAAVKKFYSRLGPDIATKLGKKEVGTRPTLETLLDKSGVKLTNEQGEALNKFMTDLAEKKKQANFLKKIGFKCKFAGSKGGLGSCDDPDSYTDDINKTRQNLKSDDVRVRAAASAKLTKGLDVAKTLPKIGTFLRRVGQATVGGVSKVLQATGIGSPVGLAIEGMVEGGIYDYFKGQGYTDQQALSETFFPGMVSGRPEGVPWYGGAEQLLEKELLGSGFQQNPKILQYQKALEDQEQVFDAFGRKEQGLQARRKDITDIASSDIRDLNRSGTISRINRIMNPESIASRAYQTAVERQQAGQEQRAKDYRDRFYVQREPSEFMQNQLQKERNKAMLEMFPSPTVEGVQNLFETYGEEDRLKDFEAQDYKNVMSVLDDLQKQDYFADNFRLEKAGGGITKIAGVESGPPPERGPNSQGLPSLLKRVRNR